MPHCAKCKKPSDIVTNQSEEKLAKNGRKYLYGPCVNCGTKLSVFLNKDGKYREQSEQDRIILAER